MSTPTLPPKLATAAAGFLLTLVLLLLGAWAQSNQKALDAQAADLGLVREQSQKQGERLAAQEAHYQDILRHLESIERAVERAATRK